MKPKITRLRLETDTAFRYFEEWIALPRPRTIRQLMEKINIEEQVLQTTAMRYDWVSRTEAYDLQQSVAATTNDPVQLLAQVREGLLERFQRLLAEGFADLKAEMTVKLLIEILLVEIAQQRTVGEATTPQDLADVSMETLLAVEHALTKKLSAVGARKKN